MKDAHTPGRDVGWDGGERWLYLGGNRDDVVAPGITSAHGRGAAFDGPVDGLGGARGEKHLGTVTLQQFSHLATGGFDGFFGGSAEMGGA